ncbi:MAG: hypothetical protein H6868_05165 [Rhodospirillales bacterium]|nr:hypothetical protein [Rhodospirillales bacterium]
MSDSGSTQLPPETRVERLAFPQSRAELKVKIIEIRGEIRVQKAREKMEGEIVKRAPDGNVRIRTERGEITVKVQGNQLPAEGQKVEIELPAGRPPQQVTIRPAPAPAQQAPAPQTSSVPSAPAPSSPQAQQPTTPPPDRTSVPVTSQRAAPLPPPPQTTVTSPPLESGQTVRFLPLPPHQAIQPASAPLETLLPQISTLPVQTAQTLATQAVQRVSDNLLQNFIRLPATETPFLTQNVLPRLPVALPVPGQPLSSALPPPVQIALTRINDVFLQRPPVFQIPASVSLPSTATTPPLSATIVQAVAGPPIQTAAPSPVLQTGQAQPATLPPSIATGFEKLDGLVSRIDPPPLQLTVPSKPGIQPASPHPPVTAPSTPSQLITGNQPATAQIAQVTGLTPQGLPVVTFFQPPGLWDTESFVLQFRAGNLPVGSQIQITPQSGSPVLAMAPTALSTTGSAVFDPFPASTWPILDELNQTLQQIAPQVAQALQQILPNAANTVRMPVAALLFIAAVRSGDLGSWLGDKTVDALRKAGKSDLLSRLTRETNTINRLSSDPATPEWKATALPLFGQQDDVSKIMIYYRQDDQKKNDNEQDNKTTRFVFDLTMTRMGAVQIDGLHRPGKLDMIVRTARGLSPSMQQALRGTYTHALEQTGLSGEMSFQSRPDQFLQFAHSESGPIKLA